MISGSFQITLTQPKWCQYIAVCLEGKGRVVWTQSESTDAGDDTQHYSTDEMYADLSVVVWGDKEAPQPTKIDPGTSTFPFQLTIPPHCPPTFYTYAGCIDYNLFGIISSQMSDCKIITPFIVSALIDLNQQSHLQEPVDQSTVKNVTVCCGCNVGEAQVVLKMPRTGFCVAQESIPVTFECRNGSSRQISVGVEVLQSIVYSSRGQRGFGNKRIGNFSCQIQPSGSYTKTVEFDLPPFITLGFATEIITVSHSVNLWITNSLEMLCGIFGGPPISIPVVIGNVPFHGRSSLLFLPAPLSHQLLYLLPSSSNLTILLKGQECLL